MIDIKSRTWTHIEAYLQERLAKCREKNDNSKLDATETARLRGEIAAIKDLLALPGKVAQVERDDPGYGTDTLDA
ncbi:hypothetical protein [Paraburkholderia youngii]|uniref:hypothetical protein n=1 Tax=Paraburkholderia youngii TaxID=2782701 RepID=UPI0015927C6A|nr:hypothetical protein [Paraburkholderia youngii]NUX58660.1 hypothetical protein [Paraburkholderia youngii]